MELKIKQPLTIHWRRLFVAIVIFFFIMCLIVVFFKYKKAQNNKLDGITFSTNLKADALSENGRKACFSEGRIYYLSGEQSVQGVYSMDASGGDIKLEIPVEDIRAINVRDGDIYYSGFSGIHENAAGPFRQFRLFTLKKGSAQPVDYLKTAQFNDNLRDENVWNFFITDDNTFLIQFKIFGGYPGYTSTSSVCFKNDSAVNLSNYQIVEQSESVEGTSFNKTSLCMIVYDGLYFISALPNFEQSSEYEILFHFSSEYYSNSHVRQVIFPIERIKSNVCAYSDDIFVRWFCRVEGTKFIFSSVRGLEAYDLETKIARDVVTFSTPECLYNQIDCGDSILVFTETLRNSDWKDYFATEILKLNRALSESLYRVNPETGEKQLLLRVGRNQAFLYADRQTAVTGGGKTISVYDIGGDSAVLLRTIKVSHNIVDRANKVDSAGGWLFLYRFNEKTQRDELIEKVFIGS